MRIKSRGPFFREQLNGNNFSSLSDRFPEIIVRFLSYTTFSCKLRCRETFHYRILYPRARRSKLLSFTGVSKIILYLAKTQYPDWSVLEIRSSTESRLRMFHCKSNYWTWTLLIIKSFPHHLLLSTFDTWKRDELLKEVKKKRLTAEKLGGSKEVKCSATNI